jgi:peptidoglycan/LPS O-acetylase OafA/YrhL
VRCGAEMLTGVLVYKYQSQGQWNRYFTNSSLTGGLCAIVLVSLYLPINHTITICIFPFLIISASNLSGGSVFNSSALIYLGTISYSLYMVHWFIIVLFDTISTIITGSAIHYSFSLFQLLPMSVAFILLNIVIASFIYRYVEFPFRKGIKRIVIDA